MKNLSTGCFIVIEGMDNSGKTTLIELIKQQLSNTENPAIRNYFQERILFTSEPYGPRPTTKKYQQISEIIFSDHYDLDPETEALLFLAARKEHVSTFLEPALTKNSLVICDRFYLSSLVYQSYLRKVDFQWLMNNIFFIVGKIKPTLTFFLESDPNRYSLALFKKKSQKKFNKYDLSKFSFKELQDGYLEAIRCLQQRGEKFIVIPPNISQEEKASFVIKNIENLIK
ncbi:dTMP kinase [Candidatus Mycoplasma haematominutum]|uniref:Thymidylate kinase n=1 Tax=Candidatus Mycoplasma haematominutum 'Birmingham 1' TaxID=1116213 RepID=G8C3X4_9MOLU|nr:dTMP kinase [Candidatus Mycoplasma haematominutum]CCE67022.1 thymidylate kinase [Candidatus Mycoplasma haematominutum 'Birmingham 1']